MRITTKHAASSYGQPVILDADGAPMNAAEGFKAALALLGWTAGAAALKTGKSLSAIQKYRAGQKPIPAEVLNVLADALAYYSDAVARELSQRKRQRHE